MDLRTPYNGWREPPPRGSVIGPVAFPPLTPCLSAPGTPGSAGSGASLPRQDSAASDLGQSAHLRDASSDAGSPLLAPGTGGRSAGSQRACTPAPCASPQQPSPLWPSLAALAARSSSAGATPARGGRRAALALRGSPGLQPAAAAAAAAPSPPQLPPPELAAPVLPAGPRRAGAGPPRAAVGEPLALPARLGGAAPPPPQAAAQRAHPRGDTPELISADHERQCLQPVTCSLLPMLDQPPCGLGLQSARCRIYVRAAFASSRPCRAVQCSCRSRSYLCPCALYVTISPWSAMHSCTLLPGDMRRALCALCALSLTAVPLSQCARCGAGVCSLCGP